MNDVTVDAHQALRALQEEAFRQCASPFILITPTCYLIGSICNRFAQQIRYMAEIAAMCTLPWCFGKI